MMIRLMVMMVLIAGALSSQAVDLGSALDLQAQAEAMSKACRYEEAAGLLEEAINITSTVGEKPESGLQLEAAALKPALMAQLSRYRADERERRGHVQRIDGLIQAGSLAVADSQIDQFISACDPDLGRLRAGIAEKRARAVEIASAATGLPANKRIAHIEKALMLDRGNERIVAALANARHDLTVRKQEAAAGRKRFAKRLVVTAIVGASIWFGGWEIKRQMDKQAARREAGQLGALR